MRIAICDDSREDLQRLYTMLKQCEPLEDRFDIFKFSDGKDLIEAYQQGQQFQIVFLDVRMNRVDGFKTAEFIRKISLNVMIVFQTSMAQYITRGFYYEASGYLIKPVKFEDVENIVFRMLQRIGEESSKQIVIKSKKQIHFIHPNEIMFLQMVNNRQINYSMNNGEEICIYGSMKNAIAELRHLDPHFFLISRSCIVNLSYIKNFNKDEFLIKMKNNISLSVASSYWQKLCQEFANYIRKTNPMHRKKEL